MADVFISYHEASAGALAEKIADRLEDAGISCWCARRDMPLGGDFAREIPPQIDSCKVFLLLLNENVYHSDHIENEVGLAFSRRNKARNLRILPLEIGEFTREDWIRYYLIHTQSVKFPENPDEQQIQRLVKRVARLLGKESAPPQKPEPEPPPAKIVKSGKCGDNVTYTLYENGALMISGTGSMRDFVWDKKTNTVNTPWWNKHKKISHIEIQGYVNTIGNLAFYRCVGLTSVKISDKVTHIGRATFSYCVGLRDITIPDGVTSIGSSAFYACIGLKSVTIPDSVTSIATYAFHACDKLTSVSVSAQAWIHPDAFPDTVRVIRRT